MATGFLGRVARRLLDARSGDAPQPAGSPSGGSDESVAKAVALHQSGRLEEARARYLAAVDSGVPNPVACCMLGVLSHQQGDSDSAVAWIGRALDIEPGYLIARNNLGLVYLAMGRLDDAEAELRKAVALDPAFDGAHASLGLVLRQRGDLAGAEGALLRAASLNDRNVEARNNLGNLCKDAGRLEEAESHYRQALLLRPGSASILQNLGSVAVERSDWASAESCYRAAAEADSQCADAWSALGYALGRQGQLLDAEAACRRALSLRPEWPDALVNLALVLSKQHDLAAAEESCRRAVAVDPAHARAWEQLGSIRQASGDSVEAEACYRRAVELDSKLASARYTLGMMQLMHGRYEEGFALVESRFETFGRTYASGARSSLALDAHRRWNGEPLAGRRLLIWTEQGFGDTLMMLRFLPLLPRFGASHVTLACEAELRRVAERTRGVDTVVDSEGADSLPEFDVHCPTMSLPFCLRIGADAIPSAPYILVPADAQARWASRLAQGGEARVGIAWAGSPTLRDDALRSVSPDDLAPLRAAKGVRWVSLQKGAAAAQIVQWKGPILTLIDECGDFLETAALIANLDLVVTVDTAVAHLAGAMGKPVWLLNRAGSEWRWGIAGESSPWYPSLRIFRQQQALDWGPLVMEVARELERIT